MNELNAISFIDRNLNFNNFRLSPGICKYIKVIKKHYKVINFCILNT